MAYEITIIYRDKPVIVRGGEGEEYYQLFFDDGDQRLLDDSSREGWKYVLTVDYSNLEETPEDATEELGRKLEAEALGKLIYAKVIELGLQG